MSNVIDRRPNGKNKAAVNRERFLKRYKEKIKRSVTDTVVGRSITDATKGSDVHISPKDIEEPFFGHDNGGVWDTVIPGNDDYETGDLVRRPTGGKGRGNTGSDSPDPFEDDFVFTLTREEFLKYFFEDMELPDLVEKELSESTDVKFHRAGYTVSGSSSNLHILRSLRGALGRRIGMGLKSCEKKIEELTETETETMSEEELLTLSEEISRATFKKLSIPFLDPIDLRYRNSVPLPSPAQKAVMVCLMDVSGSMDEYKKNIAKRFFILLYLFLTKNYEHIEVVFIRHTTTAEEVSEHDFFHDRQSGGTVVSSGLNLVHKVLTERYRSNEWNAYVAQASDGDNYFSDTLTCTSLLENRILPIVQYFAYVEILEEDQTGMSERQSLWEAYKAIAQSNPKLAVKVLGGASDIYPVFRELFKKKGGRHG